MEIKTADTAQRSAPGPRSVRSHGAQSPAPCVRPARADRAAPTDIVGDDPCVVPLNTCKYAGTPAPECASSQWFSPCLEFLSSCTLKEHLAFPAPRANGILPTYRACHQIRGHVTIVVATRLDRRRPIDCSCVGMTILGMTTHVVAQYGANFSPLDSITRGTASPCHFNCYVTPYIHTPPPFPKG